MNVRTRPQYMGSPTASIRCWLGPASGLRRRQQREQLIQVDGLGQVRLESGIERVAAVLGMSVARPCDATGLAEAVPAAYPTRHFEPVHVGPPAVAQDDLGTELVRPYHRLLTRFDGFDTRALDLQHVLEHLPGVGV